MFLAVFSHGLYGTRFYCLKTLLLFFSSFWLFENVSIAVFIFFNVLWGNFDAAHMGNTNVIINKILTSNIAMSL